jgi:hypothetical protein
MINVCSANHRGRFTFRSATSNPPVLNTRSYRLTDASDSRRVKDKKSRIHILPQTNHCYVQGRSILLTFADLMAVANAAFQRLLEFWNNQISMRATMMIAPTRNAAISERARSSVFERGSALAALSGGMTPPSLTA